jgi:hypothetical protein
VKRPTFIFHSRLVASSACSNAAFPILCGSVHIHRHSMIVFTSFSQRMEETMVRPIRRQVSAILFRRLCLPPTAGNPSRDIGKIITPHDPCASLHDYNIHTLLVSYYTHAKHHHQPSPPEQKRNLSWLSLVECLSGQASSIRCMILIIFICDDDAVCRTCKYCAVARTRSPYLSGAFHAY